MAGESEKITQDEIEQLLRQAQIAAGQEPGSASTPANAAASGAAPSTAFPSDAAEPHSRSTSETAAAATAVASPSAVAPAVARGGASGNVGDDIQFLLNQAEAAIASVDQPIDPAISDITPFQFRDFGGAPASGDKASLELLRDVDLDLRIELGRTQMYLEDVLKLKRGSVVPLDKLAGDPVDIFVNGRLVARGEVLVLNDNFCVRVAELLSGDDIA
jgi:flagellar motor switch protein FliN/FliY